VGFRSVGAGFIVHMLPCGIGRHLPSVGSQYTDAAQSTESSHGVVGVAHALLTQTWPALQQAPAHRIPVAPAGAHTPWRHSSPPAQHAPRSPQTMPDGQAPPAPLVFELPPPAPPLPSSPRFAVAEQAYATSDVSAAVRRRARRCMFSSNV